MYYVYIIESKKDNSRYVGFTRDLKNRIQEHNALEGKYSSTKAPFILVWYCAFVSKQKALEFEKYLKHGSGHAFAKKHF